LQAELAFTLHPASVGLEKKPAKSIRDEVNLNAFDPAYIGKKPAKSVRDEVNLDAQFDPKPYPSQAYLACYKWNEASISVAFEVHGTAGSALVTSCGVKSFAGRYIIHTLDVEVNGTRTRHRRD
jgi:hypothetical protein